MIRRAKNVIAISLRKTALLRNRELWVYIIRGLLSLAVIVAGFILANHYIPSWENLLLPFVKYPFLMFTSFFLSESVFFGIIPPDFYILWTLQTDSFIYFLTLLAFLSYTGGLIAYFIGRFANRKVWFENLTKKVFEKYSSYIMKWGGVGIMIAALTPLPFTPLSLLSGSLHFPLRKYILFSLFRFVRFFIYGWILWQVSGI